MRPTVRPFTVEFKTRSSKSSSPRHATIESASKNEPNPSFLDTSEFVAARNNTSNGHDAAMKAAEAVFARIDAPVAEPNTQAPSSAPTGRVLPSLIEKDDALAVRLAEANETPRKKRTEEKTKTPSPVRPKKQPAQKLGAPVREVAAQAEIEIAAPVAATPDRERRSILRRRGLDADLKAGEKWKRRLCLAAR